MYKLATLLLVASVHGFAPASFGVRSSAPSRLYSSAAQDFIDRARESADAPEVEESPKLFNDALLADMQQCLVLLETRVKEGPGCLTHDNVDDFAKAAGRILQDMKEQGNELEQRIQPGERQARCEAASTAAAEAAERAGKAPAEIETIAKKAFDDAMLTMIPPPPPGSEPVVAVQDPPAPVVAVAAAEPEPEPEIDNQGHFTPRVLSNKKPAVDPDLEEDGPAYDGEGGMGLAKGTANTYAIAGMEEMTPDEYQEALAQSVIQRARDRRDGMHGRHGNQQTNDYMQSLSPKDTPDVNPFAKGTQVGNEGMM